MSAPTHPLQIPAFRAITGSVFLLSLALQCQTVAVGWELYERTGSALALGLLGVAQFAPVIALFLPAGHLADRRDRRAIIVASQAGVVLASLMLAAASAQAASPAWIYASVALASASSVFNRPARDALLPQVVPAALLGRAVALNTSAFQTSAVMGPALGGALVAWQASALPAYLVNVVLAAAALALMLRVPGGARPRVSAVASWRDLFAGVEHVWRTRLILAVISVDLFAVLFGGATALLPVYAKDILHVGPAALGWMSAAPAVGAVAMALALARRGVPVPAGPVFLWSVAGFGLATVVFGLSTNYALSLVALVAIGALDNVSVVIRQTLVQLHTPDALRGRVSAVNRVFISSSNELGALESGLVAAWLGPVVTVVAGGVATIGVVAIAAKRAPQLRRLRHLGDAA